MDDSSRERKEQDEQRWSALMSRAQGGDELAYQSLLNELGTVIQRYLQGRFGTQHFIEDCVQDCLIAVHEARHTYDCKRAFRAWLFAIVRHKAIDHLRRQRSHQHRVEQSRWDELLVEDEAVTMEDSMTRGRLISALPQAHREAITLTKIIGLTNAEAAARLSISESALKVRVHRAIGRMRKMLELEPL
jgi:RNA polymerase sigma-70 factor, ECF subfamily